MNEFHVVFATHTELFYKKNDAGDVTYSLHLFKIVIKPLTRTSSACGCLISQIGKIKLNEKHHLGLKAQNINLKDSISSNPETYLNPCFPSTEKRCTHCLSIIARGSNYSCTISTRRQNLHDSDKDEQIASAVIKAKNLLPREKILLTRAKGGRLFRVTPGNYTIFKILKHLKYNQQYQAVKIVI